MRAVLARDNVPVIHHIPDPTPTADEVLIRVHATALNRADLIQVSGHYPPPPGAPETLGLELAGEVIQVGAEVTRYAVGDRVMALVGGGGYAELATVKASHLMPIPDQFSYEEAAGIPEVFLTAFTNMVEIGRLGEGETVLLHAGASGVSLAATQIAKQRGATVIVTASAGKHEICREHGADLAIDYKTQNFAEVILAEREGVDLIIDFIGAPYWEDNLRVLKSWGRLVYVGLMGGAKVNLNLGMVMQKRLTITGSTLRTRTDAEKAGLVGRFWSYAAPLFEDGTFKPTIWRVMPFEEVAAAHEFMRNNQNAGKIVLTLP